MNPGMPGFMPNFPNNMGSNNNPMQFMMSANNYNPMQFQPIFYQQFISGYQQYCLMNGLNPQDQNVFNAYLLMWMNNQNQNNNQGGNNNYNYNYNYNAQKNNNNNINNFNNNQNNTQNTQNQSQDAVYIHDDDDPNKPKEVVPRDEKTIYVQTSELKGHNIPAQNPPNSMPSFSNFPNFTGFNNNNNNVINVNLTASTGFKVIIPAPKDMTFEELFINFANKASIPVSAIGEQVVFLYNAEKLDPKSKSPLSSLIQASIANITVIDQAGIIGA